MRRSRVAALFACWTLAACASFRIVRTGEKLPPRPPDCDVRFEHLSYEQALEQGERELGSGCAAGYDGSEAGEFTPDLKEAVRPRACALGGDLVIIVGTCTSDPGLNDVILPGITLMVLAKGPPAAGAPPK